MEYIINNKNDDFTIIMFNHLDRNWEIIKDFTSELDIQESILRRASELDVEFSANGTLDYSGLIVDYTKKNNDI